MNSIRSSLEIAWHEALHDLDPAHLVAQHLKTLDLGSVLVIAVGKAAPAMAQGALQILDPKTNYLVITTDGTDTSRLPNQEQILFAAHPIPDPRSMHAATSALQLAQQSQKDSLLLLVSGGASALLCAPNHISLEMKRRVTGGLMRSGANIQELNTVRRHLSTVKGGGLARAFPRRVHTVILSDVIGGLPHDIGSGPGVADPTTLRDAHAIAEKYLEPSLQEPCKQAFRETLEPSDDVLDRVTAEIVAAPKDLANGFVAKLRQQGWDAHGHPSQSLSAEQLAGWLVNTAYTLSPGQGSVMACEPTLSVPQNAGRGGRAGWVALRTLQSLPDDVIVWAAASDGVDGNSDHAGACVGGADKTRIDTTWVDLCLERRDDATAHQRLGTALEGKPTGANYTDIYGVFRLR